MVRGGETSHSRRAGALGKGIDLFCAAHREGQVRPAGMVIIGAGLLQARLGHQLDHHLVVDGDKIGGKAGIGLAEVFFIDAGGKELDPEAA